MLKDPRIAAAAGIAGLALAIVLLLALAPWSSGNSSAQVLHQGDANCDQLVDARDALAVLHVAANVPPFAPCAAESGDVNCDGAVNATDAIDIMMYTVGLPTRAAAAVTVAGETCPPIGASLNTPTPTASPPPTTTTTDSATPTPSHSVTPTPTLSPSPYPTITPTPADCTGPGGGPSLPSAPPPTSPPSAGAYNATQVLSASYLGSVADSAIEFALIPGRPNEAVIAGPERLHLPRHAGRQRRADALGRRSHARDAQPGRRAGSAVARLLAELPAGLPRLPLLHARQSTAKRSLAVPGHARGRSRCEQRGNSLNGGAAVRQPQRRPHRLRQRTATCTSASATAAAAATRAIARSASTRSSARSSASMSPARRATRSRRATPSAILSATQLAHRATPRLVPRSTLTASATPSASRSIRSAATSGRATSARTSGKKLIA